MSDEDKLSEAAARAARAQALLGNELLTEAFATLRAQYASDLLATTADQDAKREKFYMAHRLVGEVERHLLLVIRDGKIAAAELETLANAAERKKRWDEIR